VKLDPSKNPKWLDMTEFNSGSIGRCIYELDGDRLTLASGGRPEVRPAEFTTEEDNLPLVVVHFRREKLPPAAGEKALLGSWAGEASAVQEKIDGPWKHSAAPLVEVYDGFLFVFPSDRGNAGQWFGGKYTVDTTKNPKWIDLEYTSAPDSKPTKLYGCYEVRDGQLRLAFGTTGKRTVRPLEFHPAPDVMFFEAKATKEPLLPIEKVIRQEVPAPKIKRQELPNPNIERTPTVLGLPESAPMPRPKKP
jgi:uncharacterized protein (TIGR03067 family)